MATVEVVTGDFMRCVVSGVAGARYQGVSSREVAEAMLRGDGLRLEPGAYAFVDGNAMGGIGVVLVQPGDFRTGFTAARRVAGNGDSPYAERAGRALAIAARDARGGADPQHVARLIARIVVSRKPKLRYVVGPSAQEWLMRLRHVLPGRWLIARHYGV